jgi:hypothetical protein
MRKKAARRPRRPSARISRDHLRFLARAARVLPALLVLPGCRFNGLRTDIARCAEEAVRLYARHRIQDTRR